MSSSGVEAIVSDYFARLERALASLPRSRRHQLLEDLREHVTLARAGLSEESELSVREILEHLGAPQAIAAEALAASPRPPGRWRRALGRWGPAPGPLTRRAVVAVAVAVAVLAGGGTFAAIASSGSPPASARTDAAVRPDANSDCSPPTDAATSGGPAAALTSKATKVAHGTVAGHDWSLWSARGRSGATGLEDGGLLIDGRAYGLCPGYRNPAELELADIGTGIVYGVIGYPGLARVDLYQSTAGTFDRGARLPAPSVMVVRGVSFFIGSLPGSACDYPALELNSTSPGVSAEHNLGFGRCTAGRLVPITASQGIWQLPAGQFPSGFGGPSLSSVPSANSDCSPPTDAGTSGGPAAALTSKATEVAHGTVAGHDWSLWSARGQSGANGLEDGGVLIDGRAYGLCPGFPNPAELELADVGSGPKTGLVYGVIGYPGRATVDLYQSTTGTFDRGTQLPSPSVSVVQGVSFFIGALPKSACDYPALELNSTSPGVSAEHNLGFGRCTAGRLVPITASQGIWQLKPGQFPSGFGSGPGGSGPGGGGAGGGSNGPPGFPAPDSNCFPQTDAATSGGPAATLTSKAAEVAHGTVAGHHWSLWSARGQSGANGLEDGGVLIDGRAYGLCPGFPNPAELELADVGSGPKTGLVYGVIGYPGRAKVHLYTSTVNTFDTGQALPSPAVTVVRGVSFFIGALPKSACDYPSLELNAAAQQGSSQHNFGFGTCVTGKLVEITGSMGEWSTGR